MDALNDYILLEIFQYLDQKSLINCSETCNRWYDLTNNQMTLRMGKRNYMGRRTKYCEKTCEEIAQFRRHYRSLEVKEVKITNQLYKHMKRQMASARKVSIACSNICPSSFKGLLWIGVETEEFTLRDVQIKPPTREVQRIPMPSLNKLVVTGERTPQILRFVGETSVRELCIELWNSSLDKAVQDFLQLQHFVKDLKVSVYHEESAAFLAAVPFKLRKLDFTIYGRDENKNSDMYAIELLRPHQQTLKDLTFDLNGGARIIQYIAKNMKIEALTIKSQIYADLEVILENNFLQKLVIDSYTPLSSQLFRQLFHVYPSIQHLKITRVDNFEELLNEISSLPKLKSLCLPFIAPKAQIRIETLKSLQLYRDSISYDDGALFELNLPNLEELTIKDRSFFPLKLACRVPNLRCLSLDIPFFTISKPFLDDIGIHCAKLHTLKVPSDDINEEMEKETNLHVHLLRNIYRYDMRIPHCLTLTFF